MQQHVTGHRDRQTPHARAIHPPRAPPSAAGAGFDHVVGAETTDDDTGTATLDDDDDGARAINPAWSARGVVVPGPDAVPTSSRHRHRSPPNIPTPAAAAP